jgi:ABC-type Fe3+-siderophore transport system permease subunit
MAALGLVIAVIGYLVVILASWLQFHGAPEPQLHGVARVGKDAWVTTEEADHFERWKRRSRWAPAGILVGSSLQLIGTILMGIAAFT